MRSSAGRPACVVALAVIGCLLSAGSAPAASIKGGVIYAGPAPEKKMIPIKHVHWITQNRLSRTNFDTT